MSEITKLSSGEAEQQAIQGPIDIANRIVRFDASCDPHSLSPNPLNPRMHPPEQRDVLRGMLQEIGWIGVAIYNVRTERLIDGHDRREHAIENNATIPVLYVDLSEEEEAKALALYDPITSMAILSDERLQELLAGVTTSSGAIAEMLASMHIDASTIIPESSSHVQSSDTLSPSSKLYTFQVPNMHVSMVEQALEATSTDDRNDAFVEICESFLED